MAILTTFRFDLPGTLYLLRLYSLWLYQLGLYSLWLY